MNAGYIIGYGLKSTLKLSLNVIKGTLRILWNGGKMGLDKQVQHRNKFEKVCSYGVMGILLSPHYALMGVKYLFNRESELNLFRREQNVEKNSEMVRENMQDKDQMSKSQVFGFNRVGDLTYDLDGLRKKSEEKKASSTFKKGNSGDRGKSSENKF